MSLTEPWRNCFWAKEGGEVLGRKGACQDQVTRDPCISHEWLMSPPANRVQEVQWELAHHTLSCLLHQLIPCSVLCHICVSKGRDASVRKHAVSFPWGNAVCFWQYVPERLKDQLDVVKEPLGMWLMSMSKAGRTLLVTSPGSLLSPSRQCTKVLFLHMCT